MNNMVYMLGNRICPKRIQWVLIMSIKKSSKLRLAASKMFIDPSACFRMTQK
jgi:hypothetical protein